MTTAVRWRGREGAAVAALALFVFIASILQGLTVPMGDEAAIIRPAIDHTNGIIQAEVKYPSFIFWFYGFFLRLFGASEYSPWAVTVARWVNATLWALTLPLLHVTMRRYVGALATIAALVVYVTAPITVLSVFLAKSESLVLVETLIVLWATQRMLDEPKRKKWHIIAALGVSLAITTKLHILPALIYGAGWLRAFRREGPRPGVRQAAVFVGLAIATTLLTWTNLWIFDDVVRGWQDDPYFQPNASVFRAVPGLASFPYDRYGSYFLTIMPLSVGLPLMVLFVGGLLMWKRLRRGAEERGLASGAELLGVFGLATLIATLVALNGTMLRIPHTFTSLFLVVYYVAAVVFDAALSRGLRVLAVGLTAAPLAYGLWIAASNADSWPEGDLSAYMEDDHTMLLATAMSSKPDREPIEVEIERTAPPSLIVLNSYFFNMCKYRDHAIYEANCEYFSRLIGGEAGYELVQEVPFHIPGRLLSIDPEIRLARFYVLRRRRAPGEELPEHQRIDPEAAPADPAPPEAPSAREEAGGGAPAPDAAEPDTAAPDTPSAP